MDFLALIDKIKRRIRGVVVVRMRYSLAYKYLYRSYWHLLICGCKNMDNATVQYYSARPNPGAGIGHQISNWNSGFWWAKQFNLNFAHLPFADPSWENFLGFGINEIKVSELVKKEGYKTRRLPKFDGDNENEIRIQCNIISSYAGKKIVFIAEQDQRYHDQYGVMEDMKRKFFTAPAREDDNLIYDRGCFNIAIHVRRGDIMKNPNSPVYKIRYISNDYYSKVLNSVLNIIKTKKDVHIYFFSQGSADDFPEFKSFNNLHWCFDMSAQQSFLHMVYADLIITSKSSFSYKPALLNSGIKICPKNFWHSYPSSFDWILCDDRGNFISSDICLRDCN